jgi:selenocysteine lyase/cysteine desulfurase
MPERLESGTLNTLGLAGLYAGITFLEDIGLHRIREREHELLKMLIEGLTTIEGISLYGPLDIYRHGGALSFNVNHLDPSMVGFRLDREYGICCRVGLHCAPDAHRTIGTLPEGTIRLSPGYFNLPTEIEQTIKAIREIATTAN